MAAATMVSVNFRVGMCLHSATVLLWVAPTEPIFFASVVQWRSALTCRYTDITHLSASPLYLSSPFKQITFKFWTGGVSWRGESAAWQASLSHREMAFNSSSVSNIENRVPLRIRVF
jgi:hypothetical protein